MQEEANVEELISDTQQCHYHLVRVVHVQCSWVVWILVLVARRVDVQRSSMMCCKYVCVLVVSVPLFASTNNIRVHAHPVARKVQHVHQHEKENPRGVQGAQNGDKCCS